MNSDVLSGNQAVSTGTADGRFGRRRCHTGPGTSLTVDNTVFLNNQTNGLIYSFGGAIANAGTLSIQGATFTGNAALGSTTRVW